MKNVPTRLYQRIHEVDMHENDSVMTCNTKIPYVDNTMEKFISLKLYVINFLLHMMRIRMMVLKFCFNSIHHIMLTSLTNQY